MFSRRADWHWIALWALLVTGAALRLAGLGHVPAGLNSDEASVGVDALALVRTGMDRWGNRWPIWFAAWGSGMNALYAYLAVPVVWAFGLNVVALRAIGAVFGVLTLPVAYMAARLYFRREVALATVALLALLPWHVMASRWALDSNLAPFWFTLGLYTIGKALEGGQQWPMMAFLPWAVTIYAYPVSALPIVISAAAILVLFRHEIHPRARCWVFGIGFAVLIDLPFLLFLSKNQLGIAHLPFESALPFSIPELPATRFSQIRHSLVSTSVDNLIFILGGFRDGAIWHQSVHFLPLTGAIPFLMLLGIVTLAWRQFRMRRPHVILIVLLSAIAPILVLPLNLTRFNWFYIPAMMAAANLLLSVVPEGMVPSPRLRRPLLVGALLYFGTFSVLFYGYYFRGYNQEITRLDSGLGNGFRVGLEDALKAEMRSARPDEPALVDVGTVHPYLYPLFYGLADIENFQVTRQVRIEDGIYRVSRFGRFYFAREALPVGRPFVFVTRANDLPCGRPEIVRADPLWAAGRCPASSPDQRSGPG